MMRNKMSEKQPENPEISKIKDFMKDERFDDVVNIIALYLGDATDEDYLDRLEDVIETLMLLHGGRTVLRFLIERLIIDIPSLLENLSKRDSVLRYSFLLLLKSMCENEWDLFLPYSEDLLNSDDPNVREADLQLLIFIAGGEMNIEDESLIRAITEKLNDEKDFVVKKAIQALSAIGMDKPSLVTRVITNYVKEFPEDSILKDYADKILKSIVSVEGIEEIVEEEEEKEDVEGEEAEIIDKELELKKKKIEIQKKKMELEEKEKELEEQYIQEKERALKLKEDKIDTEVQKPSKREELPKKVKKKIKKEESDILDKEIELKKKDLEIKKKKIELELREKELEEKAIEKKEEALKIKEELIEKENELSRVELELKQKKIKEKEKKLLEEELDRADEYFNKEEGKK